MSFDLISVAAGMRSGAYDHLRVRALRPRQLAKLIGAHPDRLVEWLLEQREAGILERTPDDRYYLPEELAEMFTDREAPCSVIGLTEGVLTALAGESVRLAAGDRLSAVA